MGDPENKIVVGKIYHTTNNDLYIDFGWKFHCVCPKPRKNTEYVQSSLNFLKNYCAFNDINYKKNKEPICDIKFI